MSVRIVDNSKFNRLTGDPLRNQYIFEDENGLLRSVILVLPEKEAGKVVYPKGVALENIPNDIVQLVSHDLEFHNSKFGNMIGKTLVRAR